MWFKIILQLKWEQNGLENKRSIIISYFCNETGKIPTFYNNYVKFYTMSITSVS